MISMFYEHNSFASVELVATARSAAIRDGHGCGWQAKEHRRLKRGDRNLTDAGPVPTHQATEEPISSVASLCVGLRHACESYRAFIGAAREMRRRLPSYAECARDAISAAGRSDK